MGERTFHFHRGRGFSLVEVVLALGIIAFAIVAILGILPVGLQTSRSAQDETRAAQVAQDILASLASQAPTNFSGPTISQSPSFSYTAVHLDQDFTSNPPLGATNDGVLVNPYNNSLPYRVTISTKKSPPEPGLDAGYACQVTVRVEWRPFGQNYRDYVRIISKY